jgi:hypothetical protein
METNEKPLQSRVFFAIMQRYTQKTRKGDFWDGAQERSLGEKKLCGRKKPKTED